jgi:D123
MPFNNDIEARYEFRIFVVNNKLTAISQQNRYDLHQFSTKELKVIEYSLNNISFLDKCPYKTYVGDVYVNIATKTCHLIELNPFGAHSGAGAALFNWIDYFEILHGLNNSEPEFRYLSIINN